MNTYDLIFSNRPVHRVTRHILFWTIWSIFVVFTYYLPHFWFVNWKLTDTQVEITEKLGIWRFVQFVIINNFMGSISTHMFFTYPVLYILMPRYLYVERYLKFILGVIFLLLITIVFTYYKLIWYYTTLLTYYGIPVVYETPEFIFYCVWTQVVFNCPTVVGLAAGLKYFKHYYLKDKEARQTAGEKITAELQMLRAQVHPHFLFNTLNSIYYFTLTNSSKASALIGKLSNLLQYMLTECNKTHVPVERELKLIQDYMSLEKERYGSKLNMKINIEGDYNGKMIAPLLLIPLVENSFKHGTSKMLAHPWVTVSAQWLQNEFLFFISNSKPDDQPIQTHNGIGLKNVKKRLELQYPESHTLQVTEDEFSFSILLKLKFLKSEEFTTSEMESYEWA